MAVLCRGQSVTEDFVVNPYVLNVNDDSFQVAWETSVPTKGTVLLHELVPNVTKPDLTPAVVGDTYALMHYVTVKGLKKGEPYLYQVIAITESGDTLSGPMTDFTIPDYERQAVTFAVVSDTQGNPEVWGKIAELMYAERPSFIVHAGDLVSHGLKKDEWVDEFFRPANNLLRYYPLYTTLGNHEMNSRYYYQYLNYPKPPSSGIRTSEGLDGDESFIFREGFDIMPVVRKGNALFIFVNTNKDLLPGSPQYRKLEKTLASSGDRWKIIVQHHPVYVSFRDTGYMKSPEGDKNVAHLRELYEDYGVDLVLNGHVHHYERTEPVYRDQIDRAKGVVYVTAGGGGGSLDESASAKKWFDARTRKTHHFLSFNIWENTLRAQAIDSSGRLFDFWEVNKSAASDNPVLVTASSPYFTDSMTISIRNLSGKGRLKYTIQGKAALHESLEKEVLLQVSATTEITAWLVGESETEGRPVTRMYTKVPLMPSGKKNLDTKVRSEYYEDFFTRLPDFNRLKPLRLFSSDSLTLNTIQPRLKDHWAARFTGRFTVPDTGVYRLLLRSYDGSRLLIDGKEVIDNDGVHYEIFRENFVGLEKGEHSFEVQYFDFTRRETMQLWIGKQNESLTDFNRFLPE